VPQTTATTSRNPRPSPDSTGADNARPRHGKRRCELQATLRQTDAAIEAITCGEPAPYIELWDIDSEITLFGSWGPPCSTPSNGRRAASGQKGPHLRTTVVQMAARSPTPSASNAARPGSTGARPSR